METEEHNKATIISALSDLGVQVQMQKLSATAVQAKKTQLLLTN